MKIVYFLVLCTVSISVLSASGYAMPVYQTLAYGQAQTSFGTGAIEVYDSVAGSSYGKAKIEWSYWKDTDSYWHYAYRIYNNGISDYHFGVQLGTTKTSNKIDKFSIDFSTLAQGAPDLKAVDILSGSTASKIGKGGWMHSLDPGNIGIDWNVTGGAAGALPISPALWNKKSKNYSKVYAGDTSRNDISGQFFELVSTWAPGQCTASIGISAAMMQANGIVWGPTVSPSIPQTSVPEPASIGVLALGWLAIIRQKKE
jgi:hypothetical protein